MWATSRDAMGTGTLSRADVLFSKKRHQEYIIEESIELPSIPIENVFGESHTWNAIKNA